MKIRALPVTAAALAAAAALLSLSAPARAEMELSVYSGWQTAPHSRVRGQMPDTGTSYDALIGWDGKSFAMPPYYGARVIWWNDADVGLGLELTHTKVYAPDDERAALGFQRLEFTDGHNIITANAARRWSNAWGNTTPYVGAGLGIALPHVDVQPYGGSHTFGYQLTGLAMRVTAGMRYDLSERWAAFGEYQFIFSSNEADLEGDGTLHTDIVTNALNIGISARF